jgi:hypothetical protein
MKRPLTLFALLLALTTAGAARTPAGGSAPAPFAVHEWGTFTSIAGPDGRAVEWLPLDGPIELPCFIHRMGFTSIKGSLPAKVRMETPVLYFYAPRDITVNVTVGFRQGLVTEWFPRAAVNPKDATASSLRRSDFEGRITWTGVKVTPGAKEEFPGGKGNNHYYAARKTDASPLQIDSDQEKFLFYRGVGGFEPPMSARVAPDGTVVIASKDGEAIGDVILFENRGGAIAYRAGNYAGGQAALDPLAADGELATPHAELERILIAHGLFPKEAQAMIETWRSSWFGEGARLFYVVSRKAVDAILPLEIDPVPDEVVRVFVGRLELKNLDRRQQPHD